MGGHVVRSQRLVGALPKSATEALHSGSTLKLQARLGQRTRILVGKVHSGKGGWHSNALPPMLSILESGPKGAVGRFMRRIGFTPCCTSSSPVSTKAEFPVATWTVFLASVSAEFESELEAIYMCTDSARLDTVVSVSSRSYWLCSFDCLTWGPQVRKIHCGALGGECSAPKMVADS